MTAQGIVTRQGGGRAAGSGERSELEPGREAMRPANLLTDSSAMNLHVLDEDYWRRPVEWPADVYARVIARREAKVLEDGEE
jgi:hypothetical protein